MPTRKIKVVDVINAIEDHAIDPPVPNDTAIENEPNELNEPNEVSRVATTDTAVGSVVPTTNEIMREYRQRMMRERIQLRQDKMKNLFANSIK